MSWLTWSTPHHGGQAFPGRRSAEQFGGVPLGDAPGLDESAEHAHGRNVADDRGDFQALGFQVPQMLADGVEVQFIPGGVALLLHPPPEVDQVAGVGFEGRLGETALDPAVAEELPNRRLEGRTGLDPRDPQHPSRGGLGGVNRLACWGRIQNWQGLRIWGVVVDQSPRTTERAPISIEIRLFGATRRLLISTSTPLCRESGQAQRPIRFGGVYVGPITDAPVLRLPGSAALIPGLNPAAGALQWRTSPT